MLSPDASFQPPAWARGGHAQTVLGAFLPSRERPYQDARLGFRRVHVPMRDGDALSAWHRHGERGTTAVLFHGLGGSTRSSYVRRAASAAARAGFGVLAVDHRGSGAGYESATRPYMTGRVEDLADTFAWLRQERPDGGVAAVGYSLSGNTLLLQLGRREGPLPDRALCVSPAIDLESASRRMQRWPTRFYDLWILGACRRWVPRLRGPGADPPRYRVRRMASLREFDRLYIAPVWGFASREEYYEHASSGPWLERIEVPTEVLTAADDPIVDATALENARLSDAVRLRVVPTGGHLGFLADRPTPLGTRRWLDHAVLQFLESDPCAP